MELILDASLVWASMRESHQNVRRREQLAARSTR
jgi:hypothetical protein